jgi:hypothetical protein
VRAYIEQESPLHTFLPLKVERQTKHSKRTAAQMSFDIGIAEGGARTHDLEVDLFCCYKSHTLYQLSYPGKGVIDDSVVVL